jgi:hypothetical protein
MLHPLARIEINKLEAHGITDLSYDEVAALQMAAVAVDEAVKSEGLPVGLPRPVRLTQDIVLFPLTLAAQDVLERATPWLQKADAATMAAIIAYLLAHGRDLDLLRRVSTDRTTLLRAAKKWARALPITPEELSSAVDMLIDAQDEQFYRTDARAFYEVADAARAAGDDQTADRVKALHAALRTAQRQKQRASVASPAWGAMTLRLAALTGCPPDTWAVQPTAEAIAAYTARLDFEVIRSSMGATAPSPSDRAQKEALRHLFVTTDAIARAHLKQRAP